MKWEYKYEKLKKGKSAIFAVNSGIDEEQLNELGSKGWELVNVIQFNIGGTHIGAVFKREIL